MGLVGEFQPRLEPFRIVPVIHSDSVIGVPRYFYTAKRGANSVPGCKAAMTAWCQVPGSRGHDTPQFPVGAKPKSLPRTLRTNRRISVSGRHSPRHSDQPRKTRIGSVLKHFIAHRLPAVDQVLFLRAAGRLPSVTVMGMEMRRAVGHRLRQGGVPLQPLVQIPGCGNVDRNPIPVLQLLGVNVNAGHWPKTRVQGIDLELILLAGLAGPIVAGREGMILVRVATK